MHPQGKKNSPLKHQVAATILILFLVAVRSCDIQDQLYFSGYSYTIDYLGPLWNWSATAYVATFGVAAILLLCIWRVFALRWRLLAIIVIVMAMVGSSLYERKLQNTMEIIESGVYMEEINLTFYEPFIEDTRASSLDEPSTLTMSDNLPRLDGATALYPLYAAFAKATYPTGDYGVYDEQSIVVCNKTSGSFTRLLNNETDIIFLMGVSEKQRQLAQERGLVLKLTPIGREAFIFFVNKKNPVAGITVDNIKDIYSGNLTNWQPLGGPRQKILAYQRPADSGSQIMLQEIMGDTPIVPAPIEDTYDMMLAMYRAVAYKNHSNALGYSFLLCSDKCQ